MDWELKIKYRIIPAPIPLFPLDEPVPTLKTFDSYALVDTKFSYFIFPQFLYKLNPSCISLYRQLDDEEMDKFVATFFFISAFVGQVSLTNLFKF